jgi:hypothetical protein
MDLEILQWFLPISLHLNLKKLQHSKEQSNSSSSSSSSSSMQAAFGVQQHAQQRLQPVGRMGLIT